MDDTPAAKLVSDNLSIKRRNSIPFSLVVPTHTNGHHHLPSPSLLFLSTTNYFQLLPLKSPSNSYTSLKDLIPYPPSSIMSPTPSSSAAAAVTGGSTAANGGSGYEISIRNRLVKQAAWAYLQPSMSSFSPTSRRVFFSGEFLRPKIAGVRRFVFEMVTRVYDWLVDALWLILCR